MAQELIALYDPACNPQRYDRAWKAVELSLAGNSWWESARGFISAAEDRSFRDQVQAFIEQTEPDAKSCHPSFSWRPQACVGTRTLPGGASRGWERAAGSWC